MEDEVVSVIVVGGAIGAGKTTTARLLGEHLGSEVFYEDVTSSTILPKFYMAPPSEQAARRYPFMLQLEFLSSRFRSIKRAMLDDDSVLDRSIYEDWYFAKVNTDLGRISADEFTLYENLLDNMLEEIDGMPKKAPDLFVYLRAPFEVLMDRIAVRGRDFEQDDSLVGYYRRLWEGYDEWVYGSYSASQVLTVDTGRLDLASEPHHIAEFLGTVDAALADVRAGRAVGTTAGSASAALS